jgi:hypothetical protein
MPRRGERQYFARKDFTSSYLTTGLGKSPRCVKPQTVRRQGFELNFMEFVLSGAVT